MKEYLGKKHPAGEKGVKNILHVFGGPGHKRKKGCPHKNGKWDKTCACTYGSAGRSPSLPGNDKCKEPQSEKVGCVGGVFEDIKDWDGNCLSRGTDWKLGTRDKTSVINNKPLTTNSELMRIIQDHKTYSVSKKNYLCQLFVFIYS